MFKRDKKDNTKRLILNLKNLNQSVKYKHFKMKFMQNLLNMMEPEVFIASIDFKDTFFFDPIYEDHQKYLKFFVKDNYKFVYMRNGCGSAICIFTKITKRSFTYLRKKRRVSVIYVDDRYQQGKTHE